MLTNFIAGFINSLALIVAIGAQNAFVLRQGLRKNHVLPITLFCSVSDALLIFAGVAGLGALIQASPMLLTITRYGGAIFLAFYAYIALKRALSTSSLTLENTPNDTLKAALLSCFGFTFLNPHVYLDTVVLVGSLANQRGEGRWIFALGASVASFTWFFALGYGARFLAPLFQKPMAWKILDSLIFVIMLSLSLMLFLGI